MTESPYATYPSLRDRVVVVTGGATGIGEHIVEHFARQASRVVFLDIQDAAASHLVARLSGDAATLPTYLHCDVTDTAALTAAMHDIAARLGTIDILVNNAGDDTRHSTEDVTPEYWDRCLAINLRQQFFAIQAVIPIMKRAGRGSIVNLSSVSWLIPSTGLPAYVASKAGIVGLTRTLAHELGPHNIRVNAVLPGAIATDRQRRLWFTEEYQAEILRNQALKRILSPEEVARLILFLAADDSSAITSQGYIIDGGWV